MDAFARELHRRCSSSIGTKRLASIFRVCIQSIYNWQEIHPEIRGTSPLEKVRTIILELKKAGDLQLIGELLAFLSARSGFDIVKFITSAKGANEKTRPKNRACQPKPTDPKQKTNS